MENQRLIPKSNVGLRLKRWILERSFYAETFRAIMMGTTVAACMLDVVSYYILDASIEYGQLPPYTLDIAVMCLGLLEAVACPLWAWLGGRVRVTLILCTLAPALAALPLIGAPAVPTGDGTEFCTGLNSSSLVFQRMTSAAAGRLALVLIVTCVSVISRAAVWTLSIATLDRATPQDISLHFGVLLSVRVFALRAVPKLVSPEQPVWLQALGVTSPLVLHAIQLLKFEEPAAPKHDPIDGNMGTSIGRVMSSWLAIAQILSTAFLAIALWGFNWHDTDIKKTRYLTIDPTGGIANQIEALMCLAVILAAVCYGMFYSRPSTFNRVSALKLATFSSLLLIVMYCVQTLVLRCSHGDVSGLGLSPGNYSQPQCSSQCGCAMPWSGFAPVCVVDTMTTYLSPCHAGCVGTDLIQDLKVYRGCVCAPATGLQRATIGACGEAACAAVLTTHRLLTILILALTVICIQVQVVCVLRAVKPRDRLAALALTSAVVFGLTFTGGHLAYLGIQAWTCEWFEAGRCQLQSPVFAYAVGGLSAGLGLLAFLTNLFTWRAACRWSKRQKHIEEDNMALQNTAGSHATQPQAL